MRRGIDMNKLDNPTDKEVHRVAVKPFCVGLPDTRGRMCWLAGYGSDPTRYYTPEHALRFKTRTSASAAITRAKKTHPFKERIYRIMAVAEMETQSNAHPPTNP